MKQRMTSLVSSGLFILVLAFSLTSCYETHYYNHYHHHTRDWYGHHHQPEPAGVNWNVDVNVH